MAKVNNGGGYWRGSISSETGETINFQASEVTLTSGFGSFADSISIEGYPTYNGTWASDDTSSNWTRADPFVIGGYAPDPDVAERIIGEALSKGEKKNMRKLYEVYVIDPEDDSILVREVLVARDKESAKLKVVQRVVFPRDLDEFDFIVVALGDVRAKKEVQEVKVVK